MRAEVPRHEPDLPSNLRTKGEQGRKRSWKDGREGGSWGVIVLVQHY